MRHSSIPATLTAEQLGKWIMQNRIETRVHTEKIELDDSQIQELEHKSSMASRAIDKLTAQLDDIKEYFKKGTPEAILFTIYPTKGIDILKANREFADKCLELGYTSENIELYGLPLPEKEQIIYVDITGHCYDEYTENMNDEQKRMFNTLFREEPSLQEQVSTDQLNKIVKKGMEKAAEETAKKVGDKFKGGDGSSEKPFTIEMPEKHNIHPATGTDLPFD